MQAPTASASTSATSRRVVHGSLTLAPLWLFQRSPVGGRGPAELVTERTEGRPEAPLAILTIGCIRCVRCHPSLASLLDI